MATLEQNTRTLREIIAYVFNEKNPEHTPWVRTLEEYMNEVEKIATLRDMKIKRLEEDVSRLDSTLKVTLCPSCVKFGKTRGENKCDCDKDAGMWGRYVRREMVS